MKTKETFSFTVKRTGKSRNHFVLFEEDTPFKQKHVGRKDLYKRRPKYQHRVESWEE